MLNEKTKVLIVDDEARMRKLISDFLQANGYKTEEAGNGEEGLQKFYQDKTIGLVILDVMMPKLNGWETLETIRKDSDVPVIMLTAKGDEADELKSFKLGANDFIQKPFSLKVLDARISALFNRNFQEDKIIESNGIKINKMEHQVYVDGTPIELSYKEFELLDFLVQNEGIALTREKILNGVWNFDYYGDERTIDTHIKKLRAKLGTKGDYIKTIWGMGYKYKPE